MDNEKFNLIISDEDFVDLHTAIMSCNMNSLLDLADKKISSRKAYNQIWDNTRFMIVHKLTVPKAGE